MIKVEGKEIQINRFPNGELLVDTDYLNNLNKERFKVEFKWVNNEDILSLYFVLGHICRNNLSPAGIDLYIYYMPYSRMDRNQNGNCFSLKHLCDLLDNVLYSEDAVHIVEPHSAVSIDEFQEPMYVERVNFISPLRDKILQEHPEIDIICYPDKGARDRFQDDKVDLPVVYCEKVRDFDTGEIKGLELVGHLDLEGKNVLILDDLCSKGGTFYYTAKKLKENKVNDVYLGVCHMEQTVKYGQILQQYKPFDEVEPSLIKHIYCSNSMVFGSEFNGYNNITIYDMEKFIANEELVEYNDDILFYV